MTTAHTHDHNHDHPHTHPQAAGEMRGAALALLNSLDANQKSAINFSYYDGERIFWYYPPLNRHGLQLRDMNEEQRKLAYALMATGLTEDSNARPGSSSSTNPSSARWNRNEAALPSSATRCFMPGPSSAIPPTTENPGAGA